MSTSPYQARPLRDSRDRPWGFLALIGAILAAAVALLVGPGLLTPPAPSAEPTVAPSSDAHLVTGALGTFQVVFDYAGQAFVVSRIVDATTTTELARAKLPADRGVLASGEPLFGTYEWSATCPGLTGGDPIRIIFGSMFPPQGATYRGPIAAWTIAPDGLFVVVLAPGTIDPGAEIRLATNGGAIGVEGRAFDYALSSGTSQASGCFVA